MIQELLEGSKLDPLNDFLNNELQIILKRRNWEICKHSSFQGPDNIIFSNDELHIILNITKIC